eukprot:scaffold284635_cov34-Prasinocladus_malaysianus.AAC.1
MMVCVRNTQCGMRALYFIPAAASSAAGAEFVVLVRVRIIVRVLPESLLQVVVVRIRVRTHSALAVALERLV